jgi:thiamine-monophosphate kinase
MMFTESAFLHQLGQHDPALRDDVYLTADQQHLLTAGTHFSWDYFTPFDLGWKAVAENASDIAATGGVLDGILICLTLPLQTETHTVAEFYAGVNACLASLPDAPTIWGGDTTRGPIWSVSITAIGHMRAGYVAGRRWQAQPGDRVLTTGPHGLSAVGLRVLSQQIPGFDAARLAHLRPKARLAQGLQLAQAGCRYALMDSSDGLADAALKLAAASGVGIALWPEALTIHPELALWSEHLDVQQALMLYGGEDFELVACWPADVAVPHGFITIGQVVYENPGQAWLAGPSGATEMLRADQTYQHFAHAPHS